MCMPTHWAVDGLDAMTVRGLPVQAAVRGQGVALVRTPFLQVAVASGDLVMPFPALRMPVGYRHVLGVDTASARRPEAGPRWMSSYTGCSGRCRSCRGWRIETMKTADARAVDAWRSS